MIFRRTSYGLTNLHLFEGVDYIVFIEGGKNTYTREKVDHGYYEKDHLIDTAFWQGIFATFRSDLSIQIRPIGSKSTALSIALDIQSGEISNVYVCMDRDHDEHFGQCIVARCVVYTCGYSWENDVCQPACLENAFHTSTGTKEVTLPVLNDINVALVELTNSLRWFVYADVCLAGAGLSLFLRARPDSAMVNKKNLIKINKKHLIKRFYYMRTKVGKYKLITSTNINVFSDCYGHLVFSIYFRLFNYLVKTKCGIKTATKKHVGGLLVSSFIDALEKGNFPHIWTHYENQLNLV